MLDRTHAQHARACYVAAGGCRCSRNVVVMWAAQWYTANPNPAARQLPA
jgi:hypothetical protein